MNIIIIDNSKCQHSNLHINKKKIKKIALEKREKLNLVEIEHYKSRVTSLMIMLEIRHFYIEKNHRRTNTIIIPTKCYFKARKHIM